MLKKLGPVLWCVIITILSGIPGNKMPKFDLFAADKIGHFAFYAIFSMLIMNALNDKKTFTQKALLSFTIAGIYGILMEYAQYYLFVNRSFDWADALANTLGALLGILLFIIVKNLLKKVN